MTSVPRIVRGAAKALEKSERDRDDEIEDVADANRDATISAIESALRDRRRTRARRKWLVPTAAVVALAAAAVIVVKIVAPVSTPIATAPAPAPAPAPPSTEPTIEAKSVHGSVTVEDNAGVAKPLTEGDRVRMGDRLVTGTGSASIVLPSGSRLDIEPSTTLRVDATGGDQRIDLSEGIVTQHVAKVGPGARYVVRAGDVEVEVRGTIFRVERHADPRCWYLTKVDVTEGRVLVRAPSGEKMLGAGEEWASPCVAAAPTLRPTSVAATSAPRATTSALAPAPASELAAQNALFGDAMAAKARGDGPGAVALLDKFLLEYPASPLHEAASAQRMRLLTTSDRARAEIAAREYVARYPHGFARTDADRILTSTAP